MPPPNNSDEKLADWERACITELIKHGGSEINLRDLRDHFRKLQEDQEAQPSHSILIPE